MLLRPPPATQAEAYANSSPSRQGRPLEPISILPIAISSSSNGNGSSSNGSSSAAVAQSSPARDSLDHCLICLSRLSADSTGSRAATPADVVEKLLWHCACLGGQWLLVRLGTGRITHKAGRARQWRCCRLVCAGCGAEAGLLAVAALACNFVAPPHMCCRE